MFLHSVAARGCQNKCWVLVSCGLWPAFRAFVAAVLTTIMYIFASYVLLYTVSICVVVYIYISLNRLHKAMCRFSILDFFDFAFFLLNPCQVNPSISCLWRGHQCRVLPACGPQTQKPCFSALPSIYTLSIYIYTHMYACWNFPLHLLTVRTQTKKHSLWSVFFPKRGSNASWNSLDTCGQTTHWHHFDIKTAGRPGNSLLTQSCQISSVLMKSLIATT